MLAEREVHVWLTPLDRDVDERLGGALALLEEGERGRAGGFLVERPREGYIWARALVRTALAGHTGVEPRDFVCRSAGRGKPEIAGPREHVGLRFNLSHTRGLAACAVALGREVGVDVEYEGGAISLAEVGRKVFSR